MENFPGEYGLKRVKLLLEKVGNPQEKIQVIHVAGTSGKGSTSVIIAQLLSAHGKKVGLHVKPHMYDLRERFQINNTLITETLFEKYADSFFSNIDDVNAAGYGKLTYFEVLISFAYFIFEQQKVDYAVIETGVGGTFDGSNVVQNNSKVCVLTSIGFDHTAILGNTIEKIASQKAGIIQKNNMVFATFQEESVNKVLEERAKEVEAKIQFIQREKNFSIRSGEGKGTTFDFTYDTFNLKELYLGLPGLYQVENATLALSVFAFLALRDNFNVQEQSVKQVLKSISIPGRFDIQKIQGKEIILDGAHNPQKMEAFLTNLKRIYPGRTFTFLIAFKDGKDIKEMLRQILPLAKKVYVTDFFNNQADFVSLSTDLHSLAGVIKEQGFNSVDIIYDAANAIDEFIDEVDDDVIVITGSLYMLSDIYKSLRELQTAEV